jgi:hypothetical protein
MSRLQVRRIEGRPPIDPRKSKRRSTAVRRECRAPALAKAERKHEIDHRRRRRRSVVDWRRHVDIGRAFIRVVLVAIVVLTIVMAIVVVALHLVSAVPVEILRPRR